MNINVTIERLILDGLDLPAHQQPRLQAAVEAELAHLLAGAGLAAELQAGGAWPALPGGTVQLTATSDPTPLGRQIARAVYGGIGK